MHTCVTTLYSTGKGRREDLYIVCCSMKFSVAASGSLVTPGVDSMSSLLEAIALSCRPAYTAIAQQDVERLTQPELDVTDLCYRFCSAGPCSNELGGVIVSGVL